MIFALLSVSRELLPKCRGKAFRFSQIRSLQLELSGTETTNSSFCNGQKPRSKDKCELMLISSHLGLFDTPLKTTSCSLRTEMTLFMQVTCQKPMKNLGSFTPVIKNPSAATPSAEKDPRILKRRRALDYLSRIPSPPPLSHLGSVASPCMNKTFNPPRRSGTPSTLKTVQTPAQKPTEARVEDELVNDEELAMIDTQALLV